MNLRKRNKAPWLISALAIAISFLLILPTLLSTSWGKELLTRQLSRRLHGTLTIDTLSLSWFNTQQATGIRLIREDGKPIFTAPHFQVGSPLWKCLFLSSLGQSTLSDPVYYLYTDADRPLPSKKIQQPQTAGGLGSPAFVIAARPLSAFSGHLHIDRGALHLIAPAIDPILFDQITLNAALSEPMQPLEVSLQCRTLQQAIEGHIQFTARIEHLDTEQPSIIASGSIAHLPMLGIDQIAAQFYPSLQGVWTDLIGPSIDLQWSFQSKIAQFEFNLTATSPQFSAQLSTQHTGDLISLKTPGLIKVTIPPQSLAKFTQFFPALKPLMLKQPATFLLNVAELSMPPPQKVQDLRSMKVDLSLSTDQPTYWEIDKRPLIAEVLKIQGSTPSLGQQLHFTTRIDANIDKVSFQMDGTGDIDHPLDKMRALTGTLQLKNAPTQLLSGVLSPVLLSHLGATLNATATLELQDQTPQLYLSLNTPTLNIDKTHLSWEQDLRLNKPMTLQYRPAGSTPVQCTVTQLQATFQPFKVSGTADLPLVAHPFFSTLMGDSLQCQFKMEPQLLSCQISSPLSQSTLSLKPQEWNLKSQIRSSATTPAGSLECTGFLTTPPGTPLQSAICRLGLHAEQFPTRVLDILARFQGNTQSPFSALFGKTLDTQCLVDLNQLNGPIAISVQSAYTEFTLDGLCKQGILELNQPFQAKVQITPEISRLLLKQVNPLRSHQPVTLEIPKDKVQIPLYPFDGKKLHIPQARLTPGKIDCQNAGNLHTALSLLKAPQKNQELLLWFAPIDFHAQDGIIEIERSEILIANVFEIALWGKMNLVKNAVNMLLGLPAATLQRAFGIQGLPADYVLTIPVKGPLDNVQIDTSKASTKLALLLAWQHRDLAGSISKNPAGALFGEVLGQLAQLPDRNAKIPPAKHPFPWETPQARPKKTSEASGKRRHFTLKEKPLKQLLKVIR